MLERVPNVCRDQFRFHLYVEISESISVDDDDDGTESIGWSGYIKQRYIL